MTDCSHETNEIKLVRTKLSLQQIQRLLDDYINPALDEGVSVRRWIAEPDGESWTKISFSVFVNGTRLDFKQKLCLIEDLQTSVIAAMHLYDDCGIFGRRGWMCEARCNRIEQVDGFDCGGEQWRRC